MKAKLKHRLSAYLDSHGLPRVILIEDNPLTAWAIKQTLGNAYEVVQCSTLDQAQYELTRSDVRVVICGSPLADDNIPAIDHLAEAPNRCVIALVSDSDNPISPRVHILEKPFDLARLADLIAAD